MFISDREYGYFLTVGLLLSLVLAAMPSAFVFYIFFVHAIPLGLLVLPGLLFWIMFFLMFTRKYRNRMHLQKKPFPTSWENILSKEIPFFRTLDPEQQEKFKLELKIFLGEIDIYGIGTAVNDKTRILVGASAVIPTLNFPHWEYNRLTQILIYPEDFDEEFDFSSHGGTILGLVGYGSTMILSEKSLSRGYKNAFASANVGLHEFMHKIDEQDGHIDGIPRFLFKDAATQKQWNRVIKHELHNLENGNSDINPYGLMNQGEFFAIIGEYFFQIPRVMAERHPQLYNLMVKIFRQDKRTSLTNIIKNTLPRRKRIPPSQGGPAGAGKS